MLNGLNPQQLAAVTTDMNSLVIACPGSGKTRVLTRKIAFELNRLKGKKKTLIALTYTNRAAEEIQKRIDELGINQDQLWAGTIHSFCYQWIIKPYSAYEETLRNGFTIIDDSKKQQLLTTLKKKYSLPIFAEINTTFDRNGDYLSNNEYTNMISTDFHKSILENKEIDFDLLLYYSYKLIRDFKKIRNHLSSIISYFFVDEYQDTQDLQYGIIGSILKESSQQCKLFLVGDPDQAIYGSLGGVPKSKYEIQAETGLHELEQLELPGNYRSTQRIMDFFTNFQSTDVNIQALGSHWNDKGVLMFDSRIDKDHLYITFAKIIKQNLENGVKPNEICVIAPQWNFLTPLAKKLRSVLPSVPFDAPGTTPLPRNRDNFWWKLSRLFLTEITPVVSLNRFRWMADIIVDLNNFTSGNFDKEYTSCRKYLKKINSIKPDELEGIPYLKKAFSEFLTYLDIDFQTHFVLKEQWEIFFKGIENRYSLPEFQETPSDIQYFKNVFKTTSGVVINTCHGVKGEEFETVIAFGLLWGYIPHWNSIINQPEYITESASKKMLYVIGSRAKRNLYMFAETGRLTGRKTPYKVNYHLAETVFQFDSPSFDSIQVK